MIWAKSTRYQVIKEGFPFWVAVLIHLQRSTGVPIQSVLSPECPPSAARVSDPLDLEPAQLRSRHKPPTDAEFLKYFTQIEAKIYL